MPGGNKFFQGGPIISEKLVPGGTNFRGVQIKRDKTRFWAVYTAGNEKLGMGLGTRLIHTNLKVYGDSRRGLSFAL